MYFYHGNEHYYLTRIFLYDEELKDIVYANGLIDDYEKFSYTLADKLSAKVEELLIDTELSAEEFYYKEYNNFLNGQIVSPIITGIQEAIYLTYDKERPWYLVPNKPLYIAILKSVLYGSIKHFFFQNRDKYLPQYDWYLIYQNPKRKAIMEMLFREFDKLTNMADSLKYYQDADDIPLEFIIYLQEVTGFSMNTYNGLFNEKQLRNLTKHLIEIWRVKGSIFSIELFFACMGINCDIQELWFDRRRYFDPNGYNNYTNVRNTLSFGYYLTPNTPHTVSYEYSTESVSYSDYTDPHSSRFWDNRISQGTEEERTETLRKLLGIDPSDEEITYTFFKSNFLLFNFSYVNQSKVIYQQELNVFKELIAYMLPIYIRTYYGNEYESMYGNNELDVFYSYGLDDPKPESPQKDLNGNDRPIEPFQIFDTKPGVFSLDPRVIGTDYVPADKVGNKFVSGSYINVYDCRYTQYLSNNGIFILTSDTTLNPNKTYYIFKNGYPEIATEEELITANLWCLFEKVDEPDFSPLITSPEYDAIGGIAKDKAGLIDYPLYSDGTYEYVVTANGLTRNDGTEGQLVVKTFTDEREDIQGADTLTRYYFKVNGVETEIHPNMFFDSNAGAEGSDQSVTIITAEEYKTEIFELTFGPQLDDFELETFNQTYTDVPMNLFESSKWRVDIETYNELYNDGHNWNGNVQYEYSQYTNPIEYVYANVGRDITVELI